MAKYTEEQLLEAKELAYNPQPEALEAFTELVDSVREHWEKKKTNGDTYIDENGNERLYNHLNRRRLSRTGNKPIIRKKQETTVDEDGWATLTKQAKKSFGEDAVEERTKFREAVRAKPNNKNLGSSKAVDSRDAIAEKHTIAFNAFEALGDDDDD